MPSGAQHKYSKWTEDERQRIAERLKAGDSARQIGALMGRTRNSVIGVVTRDPVLKAIGFARKPRDSGGLPRQRRKRLTSAPVRRVISTSTSAPRRATKKPAQVKAVEHFWGEPQLAGRPMAALRPNQCRYAVNDADVGETHLFCGCPSDGMWCDYHRSLVYAPSRRMDLRGIAA